MRIRISNGRTRERVHGYVNYTFAFPFHFNKLINSYFLPLVNSSTRFAAKPFQIIDATMPVAIVSNGMMVYLRFGFSLLLFLVRCTQFILLETIFSLFFIGMNLNKQTDTHTLEAQWTLECSSNFFLPPTFPWHPQVCRSTYKTSAVAFGVYFSVRCCVLAAPRILAALLRKKKKKILIK